MQSTNAANNFSWYTGGSTSTSAPSSTEGHTSIPITQTNSGASGYPLQVSNVNSIDIPKDDNRPITINAQNVYIEEGNHPNGTAAPAVNKQETVSKTTTESKDGDHKEKKEETTVSKAGTANPDGTHPPSTTVAKTETTSKSEAEAAASKDASSAPKTASDSNPLGIPTTSSKTPAATDASKSVTPVAGTTATNVVAPINGPNGPVQPSTAPGASTTLKDGIHDTPLSTGTATDKHNTAAPLSSATSNSTTLPNGSAHPAEEKGHKFGKKEKKDKDGKKEHKSIKQKLHDWKEHRKSGGTESVNGDVHPKDSRDGKELPSENELATKYMNLGGESAPESQNGLPKDKLDGTGKSVTGSDANPSKHSNPGHAVEPAMKQAPVEAKSS